VVPRNFHIPTTFQGSSAVLLYLSTEPLHEPCSRTATTLTCGPPLRYIRPSGVLVTWYAGLLAPSDFFRGKGEPIVVGAHRAVWQMTSPGDCSQLNAQETVRVVFDNAFWISACASEPGLEVFERQLREMVASTTFVAG
jgi:hypothetical protein